MNSKNIFNLFKPAMAAAAMLSVWLCAAENAEADIQKVKEYIKTKYPAGSISEKIYNLKLEKIQNILRTIPDKSKYIREKFPQVFIPVEEYELQRAKKQGMIFSDDNRTLVSCPLGLTSVIIPRGVIEIKEVFCHYAETVFIPESVRKIERNAFAYCHSLTGIDIPEGVEIIDDSTFKFCEKLKKVTIPESVKYISWEAFENCPLESIYISKNVHGIGTRAFPNAKSVKISKDNRYFAVDEHSALFYVDSHTLIHIPRSFKGGYIVPDGVENIASGAFENCENLTAVTLPESVTSIGTATFSNCKNLVAVTLPEKLIEIPEGAFAGCGELQVVRIPSSVTAIRNRAFIDCRNLICITLPDGIKTIEGTAFSGCDKLTEIVLPGKSVEIVYKEYLPEKCKIIYKNNKDAQPEKASGFWNAVSDFFSF